GLVLLGFGIEMAAGEDDLLAVWMECGAGGAAHAGADAAEVAGLQILDKDLVERVARLLLLGLEDDFRPVRRKVAFLGADEAEGHLFDVLQVNGFCLFPIRGRWIGSETQAQQQRKHLRRSPSTCILLESRGPTPIVYRKVIRSS